jgi:integrase
MFEAAEIRQLLAEAKQPLKPMILLAANCGFGQTDIARLPINAIDLDAGGIDFGRPITRVRHKCPLWPETIATLCEWLATRKRSHVGAWLIFRPRTGPTQ